MPTLDLFGSAHFMPEGFAYRAEIISPTEARDLITQLVRLPLKPFEFHGFSGTRRALSLGWQYDFNAQQLRKTGEIPGFLYPVRDRAAEFAGIASTDLKHALLLEYPPGAAIGWHKDKPQFGKVIGISLLADCKFRFRRKVGLKWERASTVAESRSAYLLDGPSRTEWEHSIPALEHLRYSITFRTLAHPELH
jgi:alkylated DNA repair dioxygenase AlkB